MNDPTIISMFVGVAVLALCATIGFVFNKSLGSQAEQRLDDLTNPTPKERADPRGGILMRPPAYDLESPPIWTKLIPNVENLGRLYEQADVNMPLSRFMGIVVGLGILGVAIPVGLGAPIYVAPVGAIVLGTTPFLF